jgi:TPR repeat protein
MQSLAHIYEKGLIGVPPDPKEAGRWRERARAH